MMHRVIQVLSLLLLVATAAQATSPVVLALGGHGHIAAVHDGLGYGANAELIFGPEAGRDFAPRLADWNIGLLFRYNRSVLDNVASYEGADLVWRRYFGSAEAPTRLFFGAGGGRYGVYWRHWEDGPSRVLTWTGNLETGFEKDLGRRFTMQAAILFRLIEFSDASLSGGALMLTFGTRIGS